MLHRDIDRTARAELRLARARGSGEREAVKSSLDHLPQAKQRELQLVVEILTTSLTHEIATRWSKHLNQAQILKIILFGSYARGDWVEDPVGRYFSDYDLLVVVEKDKLTDVVEFWEGAEKALLAELSAGTRLRTPVNFIVHTLEDVNQQLERGRYFFIDIVRDGIVLLDVPGQQFVEPRPLVPATALEEAQTQYEEWFESAVEFLETVRFARRRGFLRKAAFLLHQATEHFYNCLLPVLTLYTPKTHNLVRLRSLCEPLDQRLNNIWPTDTKLQKQSFELLRAAYVKARYSRAYHIEAEQLDWLQERVEALEGLVREICEVRLAQLREATGR